MSLGAKLTEILEENTKLTKQYNESSAAFIKELKEFISVFMKCFYDSIIDKNSVKYKTLLRKIDDVIEAERMKNVNSGNIGKVRVARIIGRYKPAPEAPGFITINVTSMNTKSVGAELSPFRLKTAEGYIFENLWQFSKFYDVVDSVGGDGSNDNETTWHYDFEQHSVNGNPNELYWKWREAGYKFPHPVRYPVGKGKKPICSIWNGARLGYIEARKQIYIPIYTELAKKTEDYAIIKCLVDAGYNIQLLDFDGPPVDLTESVYKKLSTIKHFEFNGTMIVDKSNWDDLVNSEHLILGHGFVLAASLIAC